MTEQEKGDLLIQLTA